MATRLTTTVRGIVPTAPRWRPENLAVNDGVPLNSDYTERNPQPGTMVSSGSQDRLVVEISHAQSTDIQVDVVEAGLPGPDGVGVAYRKSSEFADSARGWLQPNYLAHWVTQFTTNVAASAINQDCVVVRRTQEVVAFYTNTTAGLNTAVSRLDPETLQWSSVGFIAGTKVTTLVALPGGDRVLAISAISNASIVVDKSDDLGVTWSSYAVQGVRTAPTTTLAYKLGEPLKGVALDAGTVLVVGETSPGTNQMLQMASADLGTTWSEVDVVDNFGKRFSVGRLLDDTVIIGYIHTLSLRPQIRILGSALDKLSAATAIPVDTDLLTQLTSMSLVVDSDGAIYVYGVEIVANRTRSWVSRDGGRSWQMTTYGPLATGIATVSPILNGACMFGGQALVQHNWSSPSSGTGQSVGSLIFGGWSNLTDDPEKAQPDQFAYGYSPTEETNTWLPWELPQNTIYALVGSTGTLVVPGELQLSTAFVATSSHQFVTATVLSGSLLLPMKMQMRCDAGGSQITNGVAWYAEMADGVRKFRYEVRTSTTGFTVRDAHGAVNIVAVAIDMTIDLQVKVLMLANPGGTGVDVGIFYRRPAATVWTRAMTAAALTDGGGGTATCSVHWGHITASGSPIATVSHWRIVEWGFRPSITTAFGFSGTARISGKDVSATPYPLLEVGNTSTKDKAFLALRSGPGSVGEAYVIEVEPDHSVERMFPTVSPSRDDTWESIDDTALVRIAIEMPNKIPSKLGSSHTLCLALLNCNVRTVRLLADDGLGAYTTIGTYDAAADFDGLAYELIGDIFRPGPAGLGVPAKRWIQAGELVGGHVQLQTGEAYEILHNSAGGWIDDAQTTVKPEIRVKGIGVVPATNLFRIVAPSGVLVLNRTGVAADYHANYALEISAAEVNPDGRYRIGVALLGSIYAMGKQHSNGWTLEVRSNTRARTTSYGTTYSEQRGPNVRVLTMGWPDGVRLEPMRTGLDVDFVQPANSGSPLAGEDDVIGQLTGVMVESEGLSVPVLALVKVPDTSGLTITDPTLWLFGTLSGSVSANNVNGNEGVNEFYRVEQMQIVEER